MKTSAARCIITVLAIVVLTAATAVASRKAERYQAAMANSQTVPAAFDPGYRTLMDNLIACTGR